MPPLTRDEARKQADQAAVGPGEARTADLAAQHSELVAQGDDLRVFGELVQPVGADELDEPTREVVEERQGHMGQNDRARPPWSNGSGTL